MNLLESKAREGQINEKAAIRDRQSIIINAHVEKVWQILTDVNDWPVWFEEIKSMTATEVTSGCAFEWQVRRTKFLSVFQLIRKPNVLAWTGKSKLSKSIFVWRLEASDQQTIVIVEESLDAVFLPLFFNHSRLHNLLRHWLHALKEKAES